MLTHNYSCRKERKFTFAVMRAVKTMYYDEKQHIIHTTYNMISCLRKHTCQSKRVKRFIQTDNKVSIKDEVN